MEVLRTDTGLKTWNEGRKTLNKVIEAYNALCKGKKGVTFVKEAVHKFEDEIIGFPSAEIYMRTVDKICSYIKYNRVERKSIKASYRKGQQVFIHPGPDAKAYSVQSIVNDPTTPIRKYNLNSGKKKVVVPENEIHPNRYYFSI